MDCPTPPAGGATRDERAARLVATRGVDWRRKAALQGSYTNSVPFALCMVRWLALCSVFVGFLLASPPSARAQTLEDERSWFNITAQERNGTESPWRWYAEVQWRYRDGVRDVDQLFLRPAVGYDLTARSHVWLGYAYGATYPPSGGVVHEHRAWQQHWWIGPALGGVGQSRTRLEQRSIEGNDHLSWRARTFARWQKPVAKRAELAAIVYDEIFVHINDTRLTPQGFDQNRVFLGLGMTVIPGTRLEVGYLHQGIRGGPSAPNRSNHVLMTLLNVTR